MAQRSTGVQDPRDTVLARAAAAVHRLTVVTLLMALTTAPGYLLFMLLARHPANLVPAVLCLLPVGPAFCAGIFALHRGEPDGDLAPLRTFLRGYRLGALAALRLWAPALAVLGVLAVNVRYVGLAAVPEGFELVMLVIGALVVVWVVHASVITALFSFRTRDVARLAAHYLVARPLATLGVLSYTVLGAAAVYLAGDWVVAVLGGLLVLGLLRTHRPVIRDVTSRFTAPAPTSPAGRVGGSGQ